MKKYVYTFFLGLLFLVAGCEEDNLDPVGNWELTAPQVLAPTATDLVLQEDRPTERIFFEWEPAVNSANYQIRYKVVIDTANSENFSSPIVELQSENSGKGTSASITAADLDIALSYAGFPAGEATPVDWAVIAVSQDTEAFTEQTMNITRFATEYTPNTLFLTGAATEAGPDASAAIQFRALKDANGSSTKVFEAYTSLEAGAGFGFMSNNGTPAWKYGGAEGVLIKDGSAITVEESGQYKITVDFNAMTYSLFKIDKWSIVGNIIPNGWGGDEALEYQGNGLWQRNMTLTVPDGETGGFLFRANGDWGYLLKRIQGTSNQLYMESQAGEAGIDIEDVTLANSGNYIVTLDLSGDTYTYNIEVDQSIEVPSETPAGLYLLDSNGATVATFSRDGDIFTSDYLPLQQSMTYTLNSAADGSGTNYVSTSILGDTASPNGDAVLSAFSFGVGEGSFFKKKKQPFSGIQGVP